MGFQKVLALAQVRACTNMSAVIIIKHNISHIAANSHIASIRRTGLNNAAVETRGLTVSILNRGAREIFFPISARHSSLPRHLGISSSATSSNSLARHAAFYWKQTRLKLDSLGGRYGLPCTQGNCTQPTHTLQHCPDQGLRVRHWQVVFLYTNKNIYLMQPHPG